MAQRYGGGTEVWRLATPTMPPKHFYPRQPASPADGDVPDAKLVTSHVGATRIVECAIPWAELPEVHAAMLAGTAVRFTFRVNDDAGSAAWSWRAGAASAVAAGPSTRTGSNIGRTSWPSAGKNNRRFP